MRAHEVDGASSCTSATSIAGRPLTCRVSRWLDEQLRISVVAFAAEQHLIDAAVVNAELPTATETGVVHLCRAGCGYPGPRQLCSLEQGGPATTRNAGESKSRGPGKAQS